MHAIHVSVCLLRQFAALWAMVTMGIAPIKVLLNNKHPKCVQFNRCRAEWTSEGSEGKVEKLKCSCWECELSVCTFLFCSMVIWRVQCVKSMLSEGTWMSTCIKATVVMCSEYTCETEMRRIVCTCRPAITITCYLWWEDLCVHINQSLVICFEKTCVHAERIFNIRSGTCQSITCYLWWEDLCVHVNQSLVICDEKTCVYMSINHVLSVMRRLVCTCQSITCHLLYVWWEYLWVYMHVATQSLVICYVCGEMCAHVCSHSQSLAICYMCDEKTCVHVATHNHLPSAICVMRRRVCTSVDDLDSFSSVFCVMRRRVYL